jgi:general secretion pathway protein J
VRTLPAQVFNIRVQNSILKSNLPWYRPRKEGSSSYQGGFTLVELLIAITLVGIILVILFSSLRLSTRSWEAAEKKTQSVEKFRVIDGLFRRQIRELKLLFYNDPEQGPVLTFSGTSKSMKFVAPLLTHLGLGGLYWIAYDVVKEGDKSRLIMNWQPYRPNEQNEQQVGRPEQEVLLDAVEEVAFSYFGGEMAGGKPEWHDRWENPQQPPQLVRMEVRTNGIQWPQLVARIQIDPRDSKNAAVGGGGGQGFVDFGPFPSSTPMAPPGQVPR